MVKSVIHFCFPRSLNCYDSLTSIKKNSGGQFLFVFGNPDWKPIHHFLSHAFHTYILIFSLLQAGGTQGPAAQRDHVIRNQLVWRTQCQSQGYARELQEEDNFSFRHCLSHSSRLEIWNQIMQCYIGLCFKGSYWVVVLVHVTAIE